uniref:(northern house mosquito) hypothetical protein n=1 Tax=Culex pipiens TaxID=7175 RepID=A0A8D8FJ62_CULPI
MSSTSADHRLSRSVPGFAQNYELLFVIHLAGSSVTIYASCSWSSYLKNRSWPPDGTGDAHRIVRQPPAVWPVRCNNNRRKLSLTRVICILKLSKYPFQFRINCKVLYLLFPNKCMK